MSAEANNLERSKLNTATSPSIESLMLTAQELFYYARRFREEIFVIVLEARVQLEQIITDLRIIETSQIRLLIFCRDVRSLEAELDLLNQRGARFSYFVQALGAEFSSERVQEVRKTLRQDRTPVIGLDREPVLDAGSAGPVVRGEVARAFTLQAIEAAKRFGAKKIFFLSAFKGLEVDGVLQSHPTPAEIKEFLLGEHQINIGREQLEFIQQQNAKRGIEIILLEAKAGTLFQEIFTHRGRGTLFTREYPRAVRRGQLSDVSDICFLMKPYVSSGTILPVTEDEVATVIGDYFVYSINGAIVASALLKDYGEAAELAKFCTLPRFQGRGRARELALEMIEQARYEGKKYVFALSVEPKMWEFFEGLNFKEVDRKTLPADWQKSYDFLRPSKAWRLEI